MSYQEYRDRVLEEIRSSIWRISDEKIEGLAEMILAAEHIFCDGKGRSGLVTKGFAMRLAQMGFSAYDPQGVTTPAILKGDLLIVASGSGETPNLVEHSKKAAEVGAKTVLITTEPDSAIGVICSECFVFQAQSKGEKPTSSKQLSIQPMGTLFEQSLEIFFDILVLVLMKKKSISNEEMYALHNNLE